MSPNAVRIVETAAALLLKARQVVQSGGSTEDATEALRSAVVSFTRAYQMEQEFDPAGDRTELLAEEDHCLQHFFHSAPSWLGAKVAVLLRKANYLTHAAPYMPPLDEEGEWDARALAAEIRTACKETGALFGYLVEKSIVPEFRGEERLRFEAGDWVEYAEFDWGSWRTHEAVVVEARYPLLLVRYQDRRLDELDLTIAYVRPLDRPRLDLDEPLEHRRLAFERLLHARAIEPEAASPGEAVLGLARHLRTCACCGFPTRRLRVPDYARLNQHASPIQPACVLCAWNDADAAAETQPQRVFGAYNGPYSLATARQNFERRYSMFGPDDQRPEAVRHATPEIRRLKVNTIALFDGVRDATAQAERDELWRAAWSLLHRICGQADQVADRRPVDSRIGAALRSAAAEL
jgi:hypothetical protein